MYFRNTKSIPYRKYIYRCLDFVMVSKFRREQRERILITISFKLKITSFRSFWNKNGILTLILVRSRVIPSLPWRTFSPCHLPPTSGSSTTGCGMRRITSCLPQRMGPSSWPPTWWSPPTRPGATVRRWAVLPKFSYLTL